MMKQNIAEAIINERHIDDAFEVICIMIISNIQKFLGKDLGWIISPVIGHIINISKCNPLPKELNHPNKGLGG